MERPRWDASRPARDVGHDARDVERDARDAERDARDVRRDTRDVEREAPDVERYPADVERDSPDVERYPADAERNTPDVERDARDAQRCPADVARPASHAARSRATSARPIARARCYPADAMDSGAGGPNDPRDVLRKDASIAKKLLGYAYTKTRTITRAQDAAQEAMVRVLEGKGWYAWKPDAKSLLDHLCDVVDTVVSNESRRAAKRRERPIRSKDDEGNPGDDAVPDSAPNVSQQIEPHQGAQRARDRRGAAQGGHRPQRGRKTRRTSHRTGSLPTSCPGCGARAASRKREGRSPATLGAGLDRRSGSRCCGADRAREQSTRQRRFGA
jgi:hypothetical protein